MRLISDRSFVVGIGQEVQVGLVYHHVPVDAVADADRQAHAALDNRDLALTADATISRNGTSLPLVRIKPPFTFQEPMISLKTASMAEMFASCDRRVERVTTSTFPSVTFFPTLIR